MKRFLLLLLSCIIVLCGCTSNDPLENLKSLANVYDVLQLPNDCTIDLVNDTEDDFIKGTGFFTVNDIALLSVLYSPTQRDLHNVGFDVPTTPVAELITKDGLILFYTCEGTPQKVYLHTNSNATRVEFTVAPVNASYTLTNTLASILATKGYGTLAQVHPPEVVPSIVFDSTTDDNIIVE